MLQLNLVTHVLIGAFYENGKQCMPVVRLFNNIDDANKCLKEIENDFKNEKGKFTLSISESGIFDSFATFKGDDGRNYRWTVSRQNININV